MGRSKAKPSTDAATRADELDITIGCEFEFVLTEYRPIKGMTSDDIYSTHLRRAQSAIKEALRQQFVLPCPGCTLYPFILPLSATEVTDTAKWQVGTDNTVNTIEGFYDLAESMQDYHFYPIEIRSRKLHLNLVDEDLSHHHVPTYQEEVGFVLDRINENFCRADEFEPIPGKYFAFVNSSCGFHVHIGNNNESFPTEIVKKVLCLLTACEKQFDCLHGLNRITGFAFSKPPQGLPRSVLPGVEVINDDINNLPLSMVFTAEANECRWFDRRIHGVDLIAEHQLLIKKFYSKIHDCQAEFTEDEILTAHRLCDIDSWLTVLRYAKDMTGLKKLFERIGRKCTVNIQNLPTGSTDQYKRRTIEFRQHVATLESGTALHFIEVLTRLVNFCCKQPDSRFYPLIVCGETFRKATFTPHDLVKELGCSLETRAYYMRKFDQPDEYSGPPTHRHTSNDLTKTSPVGALAARMDEWQQENYRPAKMQNHIMHKLLCGGYGLLPQQYLEEILPVDMPYYAASAHREEFISRLRTDRLLPLVDADADHSVPKGIGVEGYDIG